MFLLFLGKMLVWDGSSRRACWTLSRWEMSGVGCRPPFGNPTVSSPAVWGDHSQAFDWRLSTGRETSWETGWLTGWRAFAWGWCSCCHSQIVLSGVCCASFLAVNQPPLRKITRWLLEPLGILSLCLSGEDSTQADPADLQAVCEPQRRAEHPQVLWDTLPHPLLRQGVLQMCFGGKAALRITETEFCTACFVSAEVGRALEPLQYAVGRNHEQLTVIFSLDKM